MDTFSTAGTTSTPQRRDCLFGFAALAAFGASKIGTPQAELANPLDAWSFAFESLPESQRYPAFRGAALDSSPSPLDSETASVVYSSFTLPAGLTRAFWPESTGWAFSGWTFDWHGDHPIELELSERRTQRRWFASWVDPRDWNACVHAVLAFRQSSDRHPFGVAKLLGVDASGCRELASVELPRFARMSAHGRGSAGWRRWKSISGAMHPPEKLLLDARSFDPKHSDDDAEFLDKEFSQHQVRRAPTGGTSPELPPLAEWAEPVWFVTATVHPR